MKQLVVGLVLFFFAAVQTGVFTPNNKTSKTTLSPITSLPKKKKPTFLENVQHHFYDAARSERVQMPPELIKRVLRPDRIIEVKFSVIMDNGSLKEFTGWRIQHSFLRGPAKGGIRVTKGLTQDDVQALATEMTLKTAISNLPLGGGKGGIDADPFELSDTELARLIREYVQAVMNKVWSRHRDIAFHILRDSPAPDVGTTPDNYNLMNVATDELLRWYLVHSRDYRSWLYKNFPLKTAEEFDFPLSLQDFRFSYKTGLETPLLDKYFELFAQREIEKLNLAGAFTGKEVGIGGSRGRGEATGLGVAYSALELVKYDLGLKRETKVFPRLKFNKPYRVAVQGFGNVGSAAARSFAKLGAEVVAIAEYDPKTKTSFALYKQSGFSINDLNKLALYKEHHETLLGFPDVDGTITMDDFWRLDDINILAPSAIQNQITEQNAPFIKAKYIIEGANGPTTAAADEILEERGILVLPDIFSNGGGVTVSYFEMEQNKEGLFWEEEQVNEKLWERIRKNFSFLAGIKNETGGKLSFREAAYAMGLQRIDQRLRETIEAKTKQSSFQGPDKDVFLAYFDTAI